MTTAPEQPGRPTLRYVYSLRVRMNNVECVEVKRSDTRCRHNIPSQGSRRPPLGYVRVAPANTGTLATRTPTPSSLRGSLGTSLTQLDGEQTVHKVGGGGHSHGIQSAKGS